MQQKPSRQNSDETRGHPSMREDVQRNCKILGLEALPARADLKRAYKLLIKQWHPNRFHNNPEMEPLAVQKTQQLNLAYKFLLAMLEEGDEEPRNGNGATRRQTENTRHRHLWQTYSDGFPDADVTEFFLNSSHVVSAGYNMTRKILFLKFLGDEIFLYFEVPGFIFHHLLMAQSPGKYALKFIYNRFRYRKFTPLIRNHKF